MITYEIHPAIGVARVGSSRVSSDEGFFVGPEPDGPPPANYRDSAGNLKRQAARFRIFACRRDEQRRLLEATGLALGNARAITWTVHLVNRKRPPGASITRALGTETTRPAMTRSIES
jgi:hypothetical protein